LAIESRTDALARIRREQLAHISQAAWLASKRATQAPSSTTASTAVVIRKTSSTNDLSHPGDIGGASQLPSGVDYMDRVIGPHHNFAVAPNIPIIQGGIPMALPMLIPAGALAVKAAAQLTAHGSKAGATGLVRLPFAVTGSGALQAILTGIGVESVLDLFGIGLFGDNPDSADNFAELVEELVNSGYIMTPSTRRDGTDAPTSWLHWHIDDDQARPFLTGEYIGRKFVNAVRTRERTASFRGRGGRRQARTK